MEITQERSEGAEETAAYWTEERRRNARPRDRVVTQPFGDGSCERPGYDPDTAARRQKALEANPVLDPTAYPYRTVGKLFFVSGGEDWVGSASVIARDGLMTVAHNLFHEKDGWSSRIQFVPAYTDRAAPFGGWGWNKCWIDEEWYRRHKHAYDFGLVRMDPGGSRGEHVGDVVGWLGVRAEIDPRQTWVDVGYPSAFYEGQRMVESAGAFRRRADDGLVVGKAGWLGGGASGAPWLLAHDPAIANGVHSFSHDQFPDESFSPYFRQWMIDFMNRHFARAVELPRVA